MVLTPSDTECSVSGSPCFTDTEEIVNDKVMEEIVRSTETNSPDGVRHSFDEINGKEKTIEDGKDGLADEDDAVNLSTTISQKLDDVQEKIDIARELLLDTQRQLRSLLLILHQRNLQQSNSESWMTHAVQQLQPIAIETFEGTDGESSLYAVDDCATSTVNLETSHQLRRRARSI
ncbi:hypothetical protein ACEPAF_409 [Sanghuangporus sanghuang]|uniref:Uncharacterized protein n=1 Tax=Sanghuangporus baumii TaxID=108892 RepID=A0A9Q5HXB9_SANBA|nr:hypothetical protein A7U60_g5259 [Sanghuangporus baumii]